MGGKDAWAEVQGGWGRGGGKRKTWMRVSDTSPIQDSRKKIKDQASENVLKSKAQKEERKV